MTRVVASVVAPLAAQILLLVGYEEGVEPPLAVMLGLQLAGFAYLVRTLRVGILGTLAIALVFFPVMILVVFQVGYYMGRYDLS